MAIEMRKAFAETLDAAMTEDERVVSLDADLGSANGTLGLHTTHPRRAFNVGAAEANMASIAAGMAAYGLRPVINTFAVFASRRIFDQVAISICYAGLPVLVVGTDPGVTAELNGGTHMAFEDIALMRSLPGMLVCEPSDVSELRLMVPALLRHNGPAYMRMYRKAAEPVNPEPYSFTLGKAQVLRIGADVTLVASGIMVHQALQAAERLAENGIGAEVINMHTLKPLDEETLLASVRKTGVVVTCENHNVIGGLGAAVSQAVTGAFPVRVYNIGIQDQKGEVGRLPWLMERFGLTAEHIAEKATMAVSNKNH